MFAKAAYARKLQGHWWMPKANVNANMVAIWRLLLEGVVIGCETTELKVEKRFKVMSEKDTFTWLLARLPASMLAWKDNHESDCKTWAALVASLLVAEQKSGDKQCHVLSLCDVPVPDERSCAVLAYAQSHARSNDQQAQYFKACLAEVGNAAKMGDCSMLESLHQKFDGVYLPGFNSESAGNQQGAASHLGAHEEAPAATTTHGAQSGGFLRSDGHANVAL